jgi:hypothetical protein
MGNTTLAIAKGDIAAVPMPLRGEQSSAKPKISGTASLKCPPRSADMALRQAVAKGRTPHSSRDQYPGIPP